MIRHTSDIEIETRFRTSTGLAEEAQSIATQNITFDRTAGSHSLAAAGQRDRWADDKRRESRQR